MKTFLGSHNSMQYLATVSGVFSIISNGVNQAWTSPYLPKLLEGSDIPTTSEEGALCAIMALVGCPLGAIFAACFLDRIGRKNTILLISPVIFLSLLAIAFADSITMISTARFFIGVIEGGLYTALPIYIAEISSPDVRGALTSTIDFASIFGGLLINCIGPFASIFQSSLVCCVFHAVHYVTFLWVPESPYYLILKGRFDEAKQVLMKLRGTKDVDGELSELKAAVERQEANQKSRPWDLLAVRSNRSAWMVFMVLAFTKQFSGHAPVLFYTTTIFKTAGTNIDATLSAIIYSSVRLLSGIPTLLVIDRFGRRFLLIFSAAGCAFFLFLEGLYFYLKYNNSILIEYLQYLPICALLGYIVIFSLGVSFAPVLLLGELFPTNIKAVALGCGDSFSAILASFAAKYFQLTMDSAGMYVPFWSFAAVCLVGAGLIAKMVPETKGKTLEQIQLDLINKK